MAKTRFNPEDLAELAAEAEAIQKRLQRLSARMLEANLAHTKAQFYDSRVRAVADGLWSRLRHLNTLLSEEQMRHPIQHERRASLGGFRVRV